MLHSAGPRRLHHPTPLPVTGLGAAWERPRSGLGLREDKDDWARELWWRHTPTPLGPTVSRRTPWGGKRARRYIESGSQEFAATIIWCFVLASRGYTEVAILRALFAEVLRRIAPAAASPCLDAGRLHQIDAGLHYINASVG